MLTNKITEPTTLESLGFNDLFSSLRNQLGLDNFSMARVIAQYKGGYRVKTPIGEYLAKITGKQIFNAATQEDYPAVGDWVAISQPEKNRAVILKILPRKTAIKRKHGAQNEIQIIAANVDVAFVIESADRDYNLNRLERYFAIAKTGGVEPVIILNKIDLISKAELDIKLQEITNRLGGAALILTSTLSEQGLAELNRYLQPGKTYCFLGSSGVGKSSLINKLLGTESIKTQAVSRYSGRGTHTTTSREMYFLPKGSIVIDNPGVREVGITDANEGFNDLFNEITVLAKQCKYRDCTHTNEPGCAVLAAINSGLLDKDKYTNYLNLKKEVKHYGLTALEKKEKDRRFGKFIKKAKQDFKYYGHKDY